MEDDHVDRPGVEERQRLKLTGTNSSIGLIVLIPYAHRETRWSGQRSRMSGPYGPMLREGAGRPATRSRACGLRPKANCGCRSGTKRQVKSNEPIVNRHPLFTIAFCPIPNPASRITCVLPTWWLWRSGCTRSHSELGRETLQR